MIQPTRNASYRVTGRIRLFDADGNEYDLEGDEVWLCRCGRSANKPFCDSSHKKAGFRSEPRAREVTT